MKVLAYGYRVVNRPTHEYARLFGTSHIAVWREWPTFVRCVLVNIFQPQRTLPHAPFTAGTRVKPALETWMRESGPRERTSTDS